MSAVIALFSGAQVDTQVFDQALQRAKAQSAKLVLLVVRHQHRAKALGEVLSSEGFLGRGAVRELETSLKQHRNRLVREQLEELEKVARGDGVEVETLELKGDLTESVARAVRQVSALEIVVARDVGDFDSSARVHRV